MEFLLACICFLFVCCQYILEAYANFSDILENMITPTHKNSICIFSHPRSRSSYLRVCQSLLNVVLELPTLDTILRLTEDNKTTVTLLIVGVHHANYGINDSSFIMIS